MIAADCHLALGMPALLKRAFQKIVLQRQRSDLDMQELQIQLGSGRRALFPAKYAHRAIDKLTSPLRYLIGVNVELLRKLSQCSIALTWGGSGQGGRIRVTSADLQHLFGIRGLSPIA